VTDDEVDGRLTVGCLAHDVEQPRGLEAHAHQRPHVAESSTKTTDTLSGSAM
jgi:hypothetical protein